MGKGAECHPLRTHVKSRRLLDLPPVEKKKKKSTFSGCEAIKYLQRQAAEHGSATTSACHAAGVPGLDLKPGTSPWVLLTPPVFPHQPDTGGTPEMLGVAREEAAYKSGSGIWAR